MYTLQTHVSPAKPGNTAIKPINNTSPSVQVESESVRVDRLRLPFPLSLGFPRKPSCPQFRTVAVIFSLSPLKKPALATTSFLCVHACVPFASQTTPTFYYFPSSPPAFFLPKQFFLHFLQVCHTGYPEKLEFGKK